MANPVEEHRRAQRKKDIKKNKQSRQKQHTDTLIKSGNLSEIQKEIRKLESRPNASLDATSIKRLERLQKDYKVLLEYHRSQKSANGAVTAEKLGRSKELEYPQMSIYYDERLNPFGAPPPGRPMLYYCEGGSTQIYNAALVFGIKMGWVPESVLSAQSKPEMKESEGGSSRMKEIDNLNIDEENVKNSPKDDIPISLKKSNKISQSSSIPGNKVKEQVHRSSEPPPPSEAVLRLQRQLKGKSLKNKNILAVDIWGSTVEESICYGNEDEDGRVQLEQQQQHLEKLNQKQQLAKMRYGKRKALNSGDEPADNILDPTASGYTDYRAILEKNSYQSRQVREKKKPRKQLVDEWFYKDNGNGDIQGPFTTSQMIGWCEAGFFPPTTPIRNGSDNSTAFKALGCINLQNILQSLQTGSHDEEAKDDEVQARIAALKNLAQSEKRNEINEGINDRIIALKQETPENASVPSVDENLSAYPPPLDEGPKQELTPYPALENGNDHEVAPYPSLKDSNDDVFAPYPSFENENENGFAPYPAVVGDNAYNTYGTNEEVAYGAYPVADDEAGMNTYPISEYESENVTAPYPTDSHFTKHASVQQTVPSQDLKQPLKKFEGDRAVVGFVPSHLNRAKNQNKKQKATGTIQINVATLDSATKVETSRKQLNNKSSNSVANDYKAFMDDIAKL